MELVEEVLQIRIHVASLLKVLKLFELLLLAALDHLGQLLQEPVLVSVVGLPHQASRGVLRALNVVSS